MAKNEVNIKLFVVVAFLLLGALFGMQIMNFIFVQLGPGAIGIDDITTSVTNETGAWLNATTYTVDNSAALGFSNLVITGAFNDSSGTAILTGNFTVSGAGVTNATTTTWSNVSLSYTYQSFSDSEIASIQIQNNSLQAIVTYTSQADTQFNTVAIAITLIILIAVFLVFWRIFVVGKKSDTAGGNFG